MKSEFIVIFSVTLCTGLVHIFEPVMVVDLSDVGKVHISVSELMVVVVNGKKSTFV